MNLNIKAFEAALRLIMPGPADQPLMRILRIAMDLADCPMAMLGVRRPDKFQIILSAGISLAEFRPYLVRSENIARLLHTPRLVEDATVEPAFDNHPFVHGPSGWRFIASVPIPLTIDANDLVLNCADTRIGHVRRNNLLPRLEECAAIAADQLQLIGDVASQSERIADMRATSAIRDASILQAGVPMALIGVDGSIALMNRRLATLLSAADRRADALNLTDVFPQDGAALTAKLRAILKHGEATSAQAVKLPGSDHILIIDMIRVVSEDAERPMVLCTLTDHSRTFERSATLPDENVESPNVVSDFLLATLIAQKRLLRRGPMPFHALRRWRATVKDSQLAALKALKRNPSGAFVTSVGDELATAASALYGKNVMQAVAAVPCGNSGPHCLASRLAAAVAERLSLPLLEPFEPLPTSGGSHPKGNTRRPAMRLVRPVDCPVLLIDDVATSGAHLAEAATLLKEAGAPAVLPLVWLASA
jgi:hypothetical protein